MFFRQFFQITFLGLALADLQCKDFLLHNWTTPNARFQVEEGSWPTTPAYLLANNPLKLAPKSSQGSVFKVRTCNSTSLGLKTSFVCYKDGEIKEWHQSFVDHVQVINPSTGHCLTQNPQVGNYSSLTFKPCDPDPKDASQLFHAQRNNACSKDCCTNPEDVDAYDTGFGLGPSLGRSDKGPSCQWSLQADPKHIVMQAKYNFSSVHDHLEFIDGYNADPLRTQS